MKKQSHFNNALIDELLENEIESLYYAVFIGNFLMRFIKEEVG